MADFKNAGKWTKALLDDFLMPGFCVVDATMGNGHDTLYLAGKVSPGGRVYAFDIQQQALTNTRERLKNAGLEEAAELILASHDTMDAYVPKELDAVIFNLGWLPGTEHTCTTRVETTLKAVNTALGLIRKGGVVTICVYPGHEEGSRELEALTEWARGLDDRKYDAFSCGYENLSARPPRLIAVTRK